MDKEEVEELIYIILKDQNFDFKSYPDLKVNYSNEILDITPNNNPFSFQITFITQNLDLDYEITQIFVNYFLKLFKIYNLKKGPVINLKNYNGAELQYLIDQYYLEMFGEENRIIETVLFSDLTLWFKTNNLYISMELPILEIQLEEYIKFLRSYEQ